MVFTPTFSFSCSHGTFFIQLQEARLLICNAVLARGNYSTIGNSSNLKIIKLVLTFSFRLSKTNPTKIIIGFLKASGFA